MHTFFHMVAGYGYLTIKRNFLEKIGEILNLLNNSSQVILIQEPERQRDLFSVRSNSGFVQF